MLEKRRKFSSLNVTETKMNQTTITTFNQSNFIEFYFVADAYVVAIFLSLSLESLDKRFGFIQI